MPHTNTTTFKLQLPNNRQRPLPLWFVRYFQFGEQLGQLAKDNRTRILGCMITPEPLIASLAIATGISVMHRLSNSTSNNDLESGDSVFLKKDNGQYMRARFTSTEMLYGQHFYCFEESLDRRERRHSPVTYRVPEADLRNRVIIAATEDNDTWLGYRRRRGDVSESSLEISLFGEGSRTLLPNAESQRLITIYGNKTGLDKLAKEIQFADTNDPSISSTGSVYDLLLPIHAIPTGVPALTEVKSLRDESTSKNPVALVCSPGDIEQVTEAPHAITIGIIGARQVRAFELCQDFLSEYQEGEFSSFPSTSIAPLPKGIPAAFFGHIKGN